MSYIIPLESFRLYFVQRSEQCAYEAENGGLDPVAAARIRGMAEAFDEMARHMAPEARRQSELARKEEDFVSGG